MSAATRNMNFRLELEPSIDFRKKVWFLLKFEVAVALNTSKTLPNITFKESLQIHTCLFLTKAFQAHNVVTPSQCIASY